MAYNDSGELSVSQSTYSLGGYTFELKVQTVHEPGEPDVVSVYAICRGPDGTRETVPMDFPQGTTVKSWAVEANESEATVYVKTDGVAPLDTGRFTKPIPNTGGTVTSGSGWTYIIPNGAVYRNSSSWAGVLFASATYGDTMSCRQLFNGDEYPPRIITALTGYTYAGKTVYFSEGNAFVAYGEIIGGYGNELLVGANNAAEAAWTMVYGEEFFGEKEVLVARFAIDIREADTDSWDEPGDDGPPGTTLNVTVTGATAGSCTGTPSDNETVKGYGDGGDGGYGGGGGAGASTVIIYEFATDLAGSVNQEAISRGPGTGGPGGKGGKGGDGCILIFY